MSSEKQNKMPAWKEGFLQWERSGGSAEPGESLLWEKLQDRLQPARSKKKVYFFRAAAIVLFLLAVGFLLLQKQKQQTDPVVASKPGAPVKQVPVVKKVIRVPIPVQPVVSHDKVNPSNKTPAIIPSENIIVQPEEEKLAVIDQAPEIVQQQELAPIPLAAVPQKKKLRVVHLNELNNPPPPTYASVKDEWMTVQQSAEENATTTAPSIWPGKNKHKPSVSLGN
jgi:hypothetical protein